MRVCKALVELMMKGSGVQQSAEDIRVLVANESKKEYFNNQIQQDAEEFMRSLIDVICLELKDVIEFDSVRNLHLGEERISKIFLDNLPMGSCIRCNEIPNCRDEEFLFLKLIVPRMPQNISLSELIQSHYSVNRDVLWMKCSNCCHHEKCPQTGFCNRKAASKTEMLKLPEYLFISLLRFGNSSLESKVDTIVEFNERVELPAGNVYAPISTICHLGSTLNSGHYVNYSKKLSGHWWLQNDNKASRASFSQVMKSSSYIILLKKEDTDTIDVETIGYVAKNNNQPNIRQKKDSILESTEEDLMQITNNNQVYKGSDKHQMKKRKMSDGELALKIQALESIEKRMPDEILDLQRLKNNRRKRKSRSQQSIEKIEAQKCQDKEYKKRQRQKESREESEARKSYNSKYKKQQKESENIEQQESRKENDRRRKEISNETVEQSKVRKNRNNAYKKKQKENETEKQSKERKKKDRIRKKHSAKGGSSVSSKSCKNESDRLFRFKERTLFGPSYPCVVCHQMLFQHQVTEYDESKIETFVRSHCPEYASEIINHLDTNLLRIVNKNKKQHHLFKNHIKPL